jgi:archaetidylinositol phosphate synthase
VFGDAGVLDDCVIDHVWKRQMDRAWDRVGRALVRAGVTPNAVTLVSLGGVLAACAAYLWHQNGLWFGVSIGLFELLDNVDGAVARVGKSATKAGAFLDATTDRLKEIAIFAVVGQLSGALLPALLALSLGLSASYNLARGQAEGARFVGVLPPLFERLERIVIVCVGVGFGWTPPALWLLVVGNGITTLQRLWQGFGELER